MSAPSLVDTQWLAEQLLDPNVRVLDASWYLPAARRDARREFEQSHVPGAQFFDIDQIADRTCDLPHMLPSAGEFATAVGELGIRNADHVVVYDGAGVYSSPRVWWTFRVFGHDRVSVLDGGFPKWRREARPVEQLIRAVEPTAFAATFRPELVVSLAQVRANLDRNQFQLLDARSRGRFTGSEPEPRGGVRGGHIPGSSNLPFSELVTEQGTLLDQRALARAFEAQVDVDQPVVALCGSGLTAAVLALGLHRLGHPGVAVYDGSYTEWGGRPDTPVER